MCRVHMHHVSRWLSSGCWSHAPSPVQSLFPVSGYRSVFSIASPLHQRSIRTATRSDNGPFQSASLCTPPLVPELECRLAQSGFDFPCRFNSLVWVLYKLHIHVSVRAMYWFEVKVFHNISGAQATIFLSQMEVYMCCRPRASAPCIFYFRIYI